MAPAVQIELTDDERAQLEAWARRRTGAQALATRLRIVLLAPDGLNNTEIAQRLGVHRPMVRKWRSRFAEHRLDGLTDEPGQGQAARNAKPPLPADSQRAREDSNL
jgi:transposase